MASAGADRPMPSIQLDVRPLRAILFDAVGTVLFADPPVIDVYFEVGQRFGSQVARAEIAGRFKRALAEQDELDRRVHALRTDEAREMDRWRTIVALTLGESADSQAALMQLWTHFASPASWQLAPDAAEVFAELDRRQITWGLASNFDSRLQSICDGLPPLARCRHVFASSQLGWRKPSPHFFRAIEQQLDSPPQALLLVGDDRANDYLAARSAGWQALLVGSGEAVGSEPQLGCLRELIELLDGS
jgi:putative hydrolase of the HAD superfamily